MDQNRTENPPFLSDAEIISLMTARDERGIEEMARKYGKYLHAAAYAILHDDGDCAECLNDVYLSAWDAALIAGGIKSLPALLAKATRNKAYDRLRTDNAKKRPQPDASVAAEELYEELHTADSAEDEYIASRTAEVINTFLRAQTPERRYMFTARYYEGRAAEQIADDLGLSVSSVHKTLRSLRAKLKKHLERNDITI